MNAVFNHCLGAAVSSLYSMVSEERVDLPIRSVAKRVLLFGAIVFGTYYCGKKVVNWLDSQIVYRGIPIEQMDNDEVVFEKVSQCGYFLAEASARLRDSFRIVMVAIRNEPLVLGQASLRLRGNSAVVKEAVSRNGLAIAHAIPLLINRAAIFLPAMRNNPLAFYSLSRNLQEQIKQFLLNHGIEIEDVIFPSPHRNVALLRERMMQLLEAARWQGDLLVDEPDEKELLGQRGDLHQRGIEPNRGFVGYTREYA